MSQSFRLDDRIAIITGAGAGLGRRSALLFAAAGAKVVVADVSSVRAEAVAAQIVEQGGEAVPVTVDVSSHAEVGALVDSTVSRFGRLDVMFNNAGIPLMGNFEELAEDDLRRVFEVNVLGMMFGCQHAIPVMKRQRQGVILNTSSGGALTSIPMNAGYSSTKGAINVLTRDLAVELGPFGIRVNALCSIGGMSANMALPPDAPIVDEDRRDASWDPTTSGYVLHTPRPPKLVDHARVALFLASDAAFWCSGVCMPIDGALNGKAAYDLTKTLATYQQLADAPAGS